jgi:hypothetical protein
LVNPDSVSKSRSGWLIQIWSTNPDLVGESGYSWQIRIWWYSWRIRIRLANPDLVGKSGSGWQIRIRVANPDPVGKSGQFSLFSQALTQQNLCGIQSRSGHNSGSAWRIQTGRQIRIRLANPEPVDKSRSGWQNPTSISREKRHPNLTWNKRFIL